MLQLLRNKRKYNSACSQNNSAHNGLNLKHLQQYGVGTIDNQEFAKANMEGWY